MLYGKLKLTVSYYLSIVVGAVGLHPSFSPSLASGIKATGYSWYGCLFNTVLCVFVVVVVVVTTLIEAKEQR